MNDESAFDFETFESERVHLYVNSLLSEYPGLASTSQLRAYRQSHVDSIVLQLISWCTSGRIPSNESTDKVAWPDGVWQTFKSRWMPGWFTRLFPIRHIEREFKSVTNHYFVCPHLVTDPKQHHIKFMATGTRTAGRIGTP